MKQRAKQPGRAQTPRPAVPAGEAQLVQIEKPIHGGAFLARAEGKAIFVPLVLPGEQARIRIVDDKGSYANAEVDEAVTAAAERITPRCPHFGACGGCHYQHAGYETQLEFKQAVLRETLERAGVAAPETIHRLTGEPWGYRNRIRLAVDAAGEVGYRGRRSHAIVPIRECPIAAPLLVEAGFAAAEIARRSIAENAPFEIALFCNAEETELLATVFAADSAKPHFDEFARALAERVPAVRGASLAADGRPGKPARTIGQWGAESILYRAAGFDYRVDHGAFFQANRHLIDAFVDLAAANERGKIAWDLFAGVGLFARRLAQSFEHVVAVESAPASIAALEYNLSGTSSKAIRAATVEFLKRSGRGERPDLVVVDPPRTGLERETASLLGQVAAPALTYVSCDPATLARDLRVLLGAGYAIETLTLVDLFPQTYHLETVVRMRRA